MGKHNESGRQCPPGLYWYSARYMWNIQCVRCLTRPWVDCDHRPQMMDASTIYIFLNEWLIFWIPSRTIVMFHFQCYFSLDIFVLRKVFMPLTHINPPNSCPLWTTNILKWWWQGKTYEYVFKYYSWFSSIPTVVHITSLGHNYSTIVKNPNDIFHHFFPKKMIKLSRWDIYFYGDDSSFQ